MNSFLDRFSRRTSSGLFIPEIDGLRFVAIALVVLFHIDGYVQEKSPAAPFSKAVEQDWFYRVASVGNHGVQLFFVISGFILALPFALYFLENTQRVSLKRYYFRRVTRLEPPYMLSLVLHLPFVILIKGYTLAESLPHFGASLLYIHNIIYGTGSLINFVAWSLEIEVQFYILAPFLASIFAIKDARVRRSVIVVAVVSIITLQNVFFEEPILFLFSFIQFFLMGFLLADIYVINWKQEPARNSRWDWVSLFGWPLLLVLWWGDKTIESYAFPFLTLLLYCAVFLGKYSSRLFSLKLITTIGGMCYTIYLYHGGIISIFGRFTKTITFSNIFFVNALIQTVILTVPIIVLSGLLFLLIERPCMDRTWPQRLKDRLVMLGYKKHKPSRGFGQAD